MLVPAKAGVPVAEYAPNVVKKTIVGAGHGDKVQIRMMIGVLLPKADPANPRRRRCARDRGDARASPAERGAQSGGGAMKVVGARMFGSRIIIRYDSLPRLRGRVAGAREARARMRPQHCLPPTCPLRSRLGGDAALGLVARGTR